MSRNCELPREVGSLAPLFALLDEELETHQIDSRTCFAVKLSAEELFTNMVRHNVAEGDHIGIELEVSDRFVRLELTDHDVEPFDPESIPPVDIERPVADRQPGGLGMHLVRSLVDEVSYRYENRKLIVTAVKKVGE